ncbi:MAG: PQQ-binding-like beta-propeller repeat protein, partial [Verrucomicrobiae bacterium]|nr:PQQ-binding-like beta-propeller repeat protein [Verrucomicrobiae bacterium]
MKQPIALLCVLISSVSLMADDWPQWLGPRRDGVWRETGILKRFPETGLKVLWRTPIGPGYTGPAVAGKMVIAMDRTLAKGARNPTDPFERDSIPGAERIVCLDRNTGALLWKHEYPAAYTISYPKGPRATPVIDGERVYTLGAEGHLVCLKLDNGKPVWNHHF